MKIGIVCDSIKNICFGMFPDCLCNPDIVIHMAKHNGCTAVTWSVVVQIT